MLGEPTDPLIVRIRRALAGIAEAERDLAAAARFNPRSREVRRLEEELANRRAYLAELQALHRQSAPE